MIKIRQSNTKASPIIKQMNTNPAEHKPAEQFLVISSNLANITGRTREVMEGAIKLGFVRVELIGNGGLY
jgi:hypothetical protein